MQDFVVAVQYFPVAEPRCSVAAVEMCVEHSAPFVTFLAAANADGISVNSKRGNVRVRLMYTVTK